MDFNTGCSHTNCINQNANQSVCQTISEMDWERGIWNAAFNGDIEKVTMLINKARNPKEVVNAPDNSGYTALHYAARKGYVEICDILLKNGAAINAETKSGKATPLHKAAAAGKPDTLKFLIQSGAGVDKQDIDGQTILHKAVKNGYHDLIDIILEASPQIKTIKDYKGNVAIV